MQMGELEMHPETPRTPMQKAVNSLTNYLAATLGAVRDPVRNSEIRAAQQRASSTAIPEEAVPGFSLTNPWAFLWIMIKCYSALTMIAIRDSGASVQPGLHLQHATCHILRDLLNLSSASPQF